MQRRPLGRTDLEVAPVALGCWAMGGDETWGVVDDNESIAAIQEALDQGINLIDTAPSQGNGHSERIIGKAIQGRRDQVLIATKCGLVRDANGTAWTRCLRKESIIHECESSLRRLHIETIDLYCCHWPDPKTPISETMEAMQLLLDRGKIRAIGLADYGCQRLSEARGVGTVHACQMLLSLLQRQATEELLPYCQEYNLGVLIYAPLCRGLLTGKFTHQSRFDDLRRNDPEFQGQRFARNLAIVEKLAVIAQNYGRSVGQLALNWACHYPGVTTAVVGAKRPSQVRQSAGAVGWTIEPADLDKLDAILSG